MGEMNIRKARVESRERMLARVTRTAACSARTTLDCHIKRGAWSAQTLTSVRRFASKKKAPLPPTQQTPSGMPATGKVSREVLMHELKEIMKLVVGVCLVSYNALQCAYRTTG